MPEISIVIPLFNKENQIKRALDSVLAQTFQDFEIVVVNDGSTDNSLEIVTCIKDKRIRIIEQPNAGVSAARNKGIKESKANLIAFIDGDDAYKPKFLENILELRRKYPKAGAYATAYEIHPKNGKPFAPGIYDGPEDKGLLENYIRSATFSPMPVCSSAVAIPRNIFEQVGAFSEGLNSGEDLDMWLRIAIKYPIAFCATPLSIYYRDSNSGLIEFASGTKDTTIMNTLKTLKTWKKLIDTETSQTKKEDLREYLAKREILLVHKLLISGRGREGRNVLRNCQTNLFWREKRISLIASFLPHRLLLALFKSKRRMSQLKIYSI